jgi:LPXTG-site transpeptidase (sortase) family protein
VLDLKYLLSTLEAAAYLFGTLLAGFFVVQLAQGEIERRDGIAAFEQLAAADSGPAQQAAQPAASASDDDNAFGPIDDPDTSLWAAGRIADYQASLKADLPPLVGVLEIPSVNLKVPVYTTNTDLVMDRGAGIIDGMAYPHEIGNIGISGHRDGYFRVLKDVKAGDAVVLHTLHGERRFNIEATNVVEIPDTRLLADTPDVSLTLVTCYPFYFVGHAPKRFIVTASLDTQDVIQN